MLEVWAQVRQLSGQGTTAGGCPPSCHQNHTATPRLNPGVFNYSPSVEQAQQKLKTSSRGLRRTRHGVEPSGETAAVQATRVTFLTVRIIKTILFYQLSNKKGPCVYVLQLYANIFFKIF